MRIASAAWTLWVLGPLAFVAAAAEAAEAAEATADEEHHHREKRQFNIPGFQGGQQLFGGTNFGNQGLVPGSVSGGFQPFQSPQKFEKDPVTGQFVPVSNLPTSPVINPFVPVNNVPIGPVTSPFVPGNNVPVGPVTSPFVPGDSVPISPVINPFVPGNNVPIGPITGPVAPSPSGSTDLVQQVPWISQYIENDSSISLPGTDLSSFARNRNYEVGRDLPDVMYQECRTPKNEFGRCRHFQYCILPEFANSYQTFLRYACLIEGRYIGVCCPRPAPQLAGTPRPAVTAAPPTRPPPPPSQQQQPTGCGISSQTSTRIVGGVATAPGEFPWVVSIMRTGVNPNQYCGGALLSNRHVLTAAHCLAGFDWSTIWVRIGEHDFDKTNDSPHVQRRIAQFKLHPDFNSRTFENDIALLILDRPVEFNNFIRPICLPPPNESFTGNRATVAGWGAIYYQGPVSPTLRKVSLPVWTNQDCDDAYDQPIRNTMLCAGNLEGGQDSCQDDSGGPLMVFSNGKWYVIGLVSFGTKCAEPGKPGVYARVNMFLDWIRNNA